MADDPPEVEPPGVPNLRADAARNHRRVLTAAREVFADAGPDAQVEDIAQLAGVGIGTVYRRFRTKDDLLAAVLELRRGELAEQTALARDSDDPIAGIADLIRAVADCAATDRAYLATLLPRDASTGPAGAPSPGLDAGVTAELAELLDRARRRGQATTDVTAADLTPLISGIAIAAATQSGDDAWRRSLQVLLAGITAGTL